MEAKWPRLALVGDAPLAVDNVQTVGPASVSNVRSVIEAVQDRWDGKVQIAHAGIRHLAAFLVTLRTRKYDVLRDVRAHLPHVARVGLLNVNDVERRAVLVLFIHRVEHGSLPAKRRSSVAPENQDYRFRAAKRGKPHGCTFVD